MPGNDWSDIYQTSGQQYGIDPDLLKAVMTTESGGDVNAVSSKGATGPMQLMPATARALGVTDPTNPAQAIPAAARLLAENGKQFGSPESAVLAYYGGTDKSQWGPKTQAYLAKITNTYQQIKSGSPMASTAQAQPTDDAFSAAFGGTAPTKAAPAPAAGPDPFSVAFGAAPANGNAKPGAPQTATPAPSLGATILKGDQDLGAGLLHGLAVVRNSLDPANKWVAQHLGNGTGVGNVAAIDQATAGHVAATNQFNQQYGDNRLAQVGQVGGEIAGTVPVMAMGGEVLGPLAAAAGKAAPAIAPAVDFLSGAYKGNKLVQLASKGVSGAAQGATAAGLTSASSDQPIGQQLEQGAVTGGILGAGAPALADAGSAVYNKLTGGGISPLKAALANKAIKQFGIPLRGSQISNSPFAHYLDSTVGKIPFAGLEAQNEAQRTAFTKAVAGTMGSGADSLTPNVMSTIRTNLGNNYNQVAARTNIPIVGAAGDPLRSAFGNVISEASRVLNDSDMKPLQNQVAHILGSTDPATGAIPGDVYKALTADGGSLDRLTQSKDPNVRFYASQIEKSLNSALTASASPQDAALLKQTNLQWKNMRTVQDLASKAGIEGEITPTALLGAVKKSYKDMAYSGAGQIGDLAHIGQQFLSSPPSSGSGERLALYSMLGLGGDAAGNLFHDPNALLHTAMTGAGIVGAGRAIGAGLKSKLYRDWLLNSVAKNQGPPNALFGARNVITTGVRHYALPAGVIGSNQLQLSQSPVASSQ